MKARQRSADLIEQALGRGRTSLSEHESKEILRAYAIPVTREREARDEAAFRQALAEIGFPAVVKACGPDLSHKTEQGLVYLNIMGEGQALDAFAEISEKIGGGEAAVLVQEMVPGQRELMAGFIRDGQFGPCVMFGLGGLFAEVFNDVSFRLAPLEKADALDMLEEIRAHGLLGPVRAMPAADKEQLARILVKMGLIGLDHPAIKEIDVNPLILAGSRAVAVDALIVLNP